MRTSLCAVRCPYSAINLGRVQDPLYSSPLHLINRHSLGHAVGLNGFPVGDGRKKPFKILAAATGHFAAQVVHRSHAANFSAALSQKLVNRIPLALGQRWMLRCSDSGSRTVTLLMDSILKT